MHTAAAQPNTLLSAAKNFIRKSAGTAVLAIAPLAAVSVAPDANAQTAIFGAGGTSGGFGTHPVYGYVGSTSANDPFSEALGGSGVRFGASSVFVAASGGSGGGSGQFANIGFYSTSSSSGSLPFGSQVTFGYDFTLTPGTNLTIDSWSVKVNLYDQYSSPGFEHTITGTGGDPTNGTYLININETTAPGGLADFSAYNVYLQVSFTSASGGETLTLSMDQLSGQGFSFAAVPEPSTYAALLGLGALGFVILRRRRTA